MNNALKTSLLLPVLFLGIQGTAFARENPNAVYQGAGSQRDAASAIATGKRQHKPFVAVQPSGQPAPAPASKSFKGHTPPPQPIGLLLPAVQKVRAAQ